MLRGGGGNGSHTLPNHVTGNGRSTRHTRLVIKPTRHTARNFFFHTNSSTSLLNHRHCFCDWGRRYSQVRFPAIHLHPTQTTPRVAHCQPAPSPYPRTTSGRPDHIVRTSFHHNRLSRYSETFMYKHNLLRQKHFKVPRVHL